MTKPLASRRQFISGATMAVAAAAVPSHGPWAAGDPGPRILDVVTRTIEVKGKAASVYGLVGANGKHGLEFIAGESFYVRLNNKILEPTLIHWHGLTPPSHQDGVPILSHDPVGPGASQLYDFRLTEPGTHWMHSHFNLTQMQRLMTSPLIVRSPDERRLDEQEVVLMLNDFTFRDPEEILAGLKSTTHAARTGSGSHHIPAGESGAKVAAPAPAPMTGMAAMPGHAGMPGMAGMSGMSGMSGSAATPAPAAASPAPAAPSAAAGDMSGRMMAGMQMDVNDIEFDAYLANDRTLDDPQVTTVEPGGRVRLRVIVGTASTNFFLDLGALEGELIAVDGQPVLPVRARRFPIAMAQRIDVRLALPAGDGAYPILAQREDDTVRTGIVLATRRAGIRRIDENAAEKAGIVGLELERRLQPLRPLTLRPVDRSHDVELGGTMESYTWTINGAVYGQDKPLMVSLGERVELVLRNATEMAHPMHLHGTAFQVVEIGGKRINGAKRDTVMVPAEETVVVAFDAENAGRWAFHCHNSYHQEAGMMTSVEYA